MIKISKLTKSYYGQTIVDNLTLTVKSGSVFGFLGPNGAGKTTTMKMLVGLNKPDSGSILIDKCDPSLAETRKVIGFMPENPYFYDHLTGLELLKFCHELSAPASSSLRGGTTKCPEGKPCGQSKSDQIAAPRKIPMARNDKFDQILNDVGLSSAKNKMINTYSKGMKQRLGLAQAIVHNPNYIFLDEPLDGLDPIGRIEIKKIINKLKKQGKTIFFNSHILADVEEICDEIGIINKGKLIYAGDVKKFRGKKSLEEAFVDIINKS